MFLSSVHVNTDIQTGSGTYHCYCFFFILLGVLHIFFLFCIFFFTNNVAESNGVWQMRQRQQGNDICTYPLYARSKKGNIGKLMTKCATFPTCIGNFQLISKTNVVVNEESIARQCLPPSDCHFPYCSQVYIRGLLCTLAAVYGIVLMVAGYYVRTSPRQTKSFITMWSDAILKQWQQHSCSQCRAVAGLILD